jgi:hypothetical protein
MLLLADNAEVYAVGWGTLSLLAAGIAQGKNRSGLAWFAVTVLLGPIGVFSLALSPKLPSHEVQAIPTPPQN